MRDLSERGACSKKRHIPQSQHPMFPQLPQELVASRAVHSGAVAALQDLGEK